MPQHTYSVSDTRFLSKLAEWGPDDGFGPMEDPIEKEEPSLASRVVVLKHMFTLDELKEDPSLLLDLKEEVREEAEGLGDVTNVVLYDVRAPSQSTCSLCTNNGRSYSLNPMGS